MWTDKGTTLAGLEYAWIGDEMPSSLPPAHRVRAAAR